MARKADAGRRLIRTVTVSNDGEIAAARFDSRKSLVMIPRWRATCSTAGCRQESLGRTALPRSRPFRPLRGS